LNRDHLRTVATVAIFTLLGPPLAGALVVIGLIWESVLSEPAFLWMGWYGAIYAFLPGLVPALVGGLVAAWLSRKLANPWLWLLACAGLGALGSAAGGLIGGYSPAAISQAGFLGLAMMAGAVTGLVCGGFAVGLRPRPYGSA